MYTNQKFGGAGSITIYAGGRLIGKSETGDILYNTANEITSAINSFRTYPDYFASCLNPAADPVTVTISAPNELGADQNGVLLGSTLTGSLVTVSADNILSNGVSPADTYVYWSENDPDQPNANLKYWGTKRLNWEVFNSTTWENGYAHSWYDFEFNNDWLGGYELHTLVPGDHVKISTGNSTYPYPVGVTFTNGLSGLTIQEAADQLNNSGEPHITNFYYRPMPSNVGGLGTTAGAVNITSGNHLLFNGLFQPPPSLIGGSQLLIPGFGYTGGVQITTSTTTTTTSTSTTSTTTTTTIAPTSSTTSTTTTSTSTTSTSTTSTTTAAPDCGLAGDAEMQYPATTSTTTTTTIDPTPDTVTIYWRKLSLVLDSEYFTVDLEDPVTGLYIGYSVFNINTPNSGDTTIVAPVGAKLYAAIATTPGAVGSTITIYDDYPTNSNEVAYASGASPSIFPPITLEAGKTYYIGASVDIGGGGGGFGP